MRNYPDDENNRTNRKFTHEQMEGAYGRRRRTKGIAYNTEITKREKGPEGVFVKY